MSQTIVSLDFGADQSNVASPRVDVEQVVAAEGDQQVFDKYINSQGFFTLNFLLRSRKFPVHCIANYFYYILFLRFCFGVVYKSRNLLPPNPASSLIFRTKS